MSVTCFDCNQTMVQINNCCFICQNCLKIIKECCICGEYSTKFACWSTPKNEFLNKSNCQFPYFHLDDYSETNVYFDSVTNETIENCVSNLGVEDQNLAKPNIKFYLWCVVCEIII